MKKNNKLMEMMAVAVMMAGGLSQLASAQPAEKIGNGGKGYEAEFAGFKSEVLNWTKKTELKDLNLNGIAADQLVATLNSQKVVVSFVDQDLYVGSKRRTCKNYPSESLIECQKSAWTTENTKTKYFLVFHELLGLAGVETNIGEESDYQISGQIRDFIEAKTMYSLSPVRLSDDVQMMVSCYAGNGFGRNSLKRRNEARIDFFPDGTLFSMKKQYPRGYTGERQCVNESCTKSRYSGSYYFLQVLGEKEKTLERLESKVKIDEWSTLSQFAQVVEMNGEKRRLTLLMPPRDNYEKCVHGRELGSYDCNTKTGILTEATLVNNNYSPEYFYQRVKNVIQYTCQWQKVYPDQIAAMMERARKEMGVK